MFIAFRFVAGAAAFMILAAVPMLINETVPIHMLGALVDVHAVMLVLGYTIQGWVGFGFFFWQMVARIPGDLPLPFSASGHCVYL